MSEIQRNLLIGLLIAGVIAMGFYLVITKNAAPSSGQNNSASTTAGGVSGTGSYTVENVGVTPPSLERPIIVTSSSLSESDKKIVRTMLERQIALLRAEPNRVDLWLQLGVNRKVAGDYEGAIEAWEYVAQTAPKDISATAHGNLGDLYMYFLKDYAKADTRFTQAITLNPNVVEYYRALFYLYKDIFKDTVKARAILKRGLEANPNNADLLRYQSELEGQTP